MQTLKQDFCESQLQAIELDKNKIKLAYKLVSEDTISTVNTYVLGTVSKKTYYFSIKDIDEYTISIEHKGLIDSLEQFSFCLINLTQKVIINPIILGRQVDIFGRVLGNDTIYNLKKKNKINNLPTKNFYLKSNQSIEPNFVYLGLNIEQNLRSLINCQINNARNYIFIYLLPLNNLTDGTKILSILGKNNLHKKNLCLNIEGAKNYRIILDYIEYFKNSLNQDTAIMVNPSDWSEDELLELLWLLENIPKIILLGTKKLVLTIFVL